MPVQAVLAAAAPAQDGAARRRGREADHQDDEPGLAPVGPGRNGRRQRADAEPGSQHPADNRQRQAVLLRVVFQLVVKPLLPGGKRDGFVCKVAGGKRLAHFMDHARKAAEHGGAEPAARLHDVADGCVKIGIRRAVRGRAAGVFLVGVFRPVGFVGVFKRHGIFS